MKSPLRIGLIAVCFVFTLFSGVSVSAQEWQPVTKEELTSKTPEVEPGADAEAIFWVVRADDSDEKFLVLKHQVRVKIYTERGREQFSKRDIEFYKGNRVIDVEARVTKPDGSIVFLKKEDVVERDLVKVDGFKIKAKSFALPGLEIGSIVEYRYKEVVEGEANLRLLFQQDIPIRTISFYIRPFRGERAMYQRLFNMPSGFVKDKDGYHRASMAAVPSLKEEPHMLPADQVRSWAYIYYSHRDEIKPAEYWKDINKFFYDRSKDAMKASDEIKATTTQVINGAATEDEKLRRIFDYTKNEIRNLSYSLNVTDDEKKRARNIKTAGEVLKLKMAFGNEIDVLFGAMARAAGFDARLTLSGSRAELFFDPNITNVDLTLNSYNIAVKTASGWRFFTPASRFTSYGYLTWQEEGQKALVTDAKEPIWVDVPLSPAAKSLEKRTGKFKLLEDGTLEGEARVEFTGHLAETHKRRNWDDSAAEQESRLKNLIRENISGTVEVEKFTIENATDPEQPFVYTFKVKVPGYGSRTGKRIFFQPNIFEHSAKPEFTSSTRKYDVYINYPYASQDDITIELPKGFTLESPDAPKMVKDGQGISSHQVQMSIANDGSFIQYKRNFSFGNGGFIRFPAGSYGAIKGLFDAFNKADVHQMTLRQDAAK